MESRPRQNKTPPIGGAGWRPLARAIEQLSHFDLRNLRWRPLVPEQRAGVSGVMVCAGCIRFRLCAHNDRGPTGGSRA